MRFDKKGPVMLAVTVKVYQGLLCCAERASAGSNGKDMRRHDAEVIAQ
jgi:hypothetical protein